jgi:hypothetical protein
VKPNKQVADLAGKPFYLFLWKMLVEPRPLLTLQIQLFSYASGTTSEKGSAYQ